MADQSIADSIFLEDKGYSLAMHYRQADDKTKTEAIVLFEQVFQSLGLEEFRYQAGKEVLELIPVEFNKGACVEFLMDYWQQEKPESNWLPVYLGDDLTDEAAFMMVNQLGGSSVRVGIDGAETIAMSSIGSTHLVYYFLSQMLGAGAI